MKSKLWYQQLKDDCFGLSSKHLQDLEDIIGKSMVFSKTEHHRLIQFLEALDEKGVNSAKALKDWTFQLRKKLKFQPSRCKLAKVYFRDVLWPRWSNSNHPVDANISLQLYEAFLDTNSVQGSYGTVNITVITEPLDSCRYKCAYN